MDGNATSRAWRRALKVPEQVQHLAGAAFKTLHRIAWIESCGRRDRRDSPPIVQEKQASIGNAAGMGRETVNRAINGVLVPLGFVTKQQQAPLVDGKFRPLLYRVTTEGWKRLRMAKTAPPKLIDRVRYNSHGIVEKYVLAPENAYVFGSRDPPD